jgi:hypothetical protein
MIITTMIIAVPPFTITVDAIPKCQSVATISAVKASVTTIVVLLLQHFFQVVISVWYGNIG